MKQLRRHLTHLGLLLTLLVVLCLGLAACSGYSSPGSGAPPNSTPSSGGGY